MKDDQPFDIGGLWENWKDPASGEWVRTFVIAARGLVAVMQQVAWTRVVAQPADAHVADFDAGE